jgi:hypothetical protein
LREIVHGFATEASGTDIRAEASVIRTRTVTYGDDSTTNDDREGPSEGLSEPCGPLGREWGLIAGIGAGGLVVGAAVTALIVWLVMRRKKGGERSWSGEVEEIRGMGFGGTTELSTLQTLETQRTDLHF